MKENQKRDPDEAWGEWGTELQKPGEGVSEGFFTSASKSHFGRENTGMEVA